MLRALTRSNGAARRDQRKVGGRLSWRSLDQYGSPLRNIVQSRYPCSPLFEECRVSARVDRTASCSTDITKRLPAQTSVFLPPLYTGPTKVACPTGSSVLRSKCLYRVSFANSYASVSCPDQRIGCRVRPLPSKAGGGCRFAHQSNSDMAASRAFNHSSTLPLLLITPMRFHLSSQARLSRIEWKRFMGTAVISKGMRGVAVPCPALRSLVSWCTLVLVRSDVLIGDDIALVVDRFQTNDVSSRF
jgi:hypothetical protein